MRSKSFELSISFLLIVIAASVLGDGARGQVWGAVLPSTAVSQARRDAPPSPAPASGRPAGQQRSCVTGRVDDVFMMSGGKEVLVRLVEPTNEVTLTLQEALRTGLVTGGTTAKPGRSGGKTTTVISTLYMAGAPAWKLTLDCPAPGGFYRVLAIDKRLPGKDGAAVGLDPDDAKKLRIAGADPPMPGRGQLVFCDLVVSETGAVSVMRCRETDPPALADAARELLGKWKYRPYIVQGKAVSFSLDAAVWIPLPKEESK